MAISGGANDPYVHSNIANWSVGGYESLPTFIEKNKVNDAIASLEGVRDELKREAEDFLNGDTLDFLNFCIDNEYHTYAQLAVQLLQEPDAITALLKGETSLQMSKKDVKDLLKDVPNNLKKEIFDYININNIETIGARTLARELAEVFGNMHMTVGMQGGEFIRPLVQSVAGISDFDTVKKITEVAVNNLSSGAKTGRMVDAIENTIKKGGLYKQKGKIQKKQYK